MTTSHSAVEADRLGVSRETFDDLDTYVAMLGRWNMKINLISGSTVDEVWNRHILDSLQLRQFIPETASSVLDMGSGGGFPGLVLAIAGKYEHPGRTFTLVDSDQRKCVFLTAVASSLAKGVRVLPGRIENLRPQGADVVVARAFARLDKLIGYAHIHLKAGGKALFLKGEESENEISEAQEKWNFSVEKRPSLTGDQGSILIIGDISAR